jgi:hypothetical protein
MLATVYQNQQPNSTGIILSGLALNYQTARLKGGENEMAKGSVVQRSGNWYAVYRDGGTQKFSLRSIRQFGWLTMPKSLLRNLPITAMKLL